MGHLGATVGHISVTIGHIRVTIGHLRVTMGHLKVAVVHLTFLSLSKHEANTTELHPKVRQTCFMSKTTPHIPLLFTYFKNCLLFDLEQTVFQYSCLLFRTKNALFVFYASSL